MEMLFFDMLSALYESTLNDLAVKAAPYPDKSFCLLSKRVNQVSFLQANNVSIVVCSSFLTSSNMSKNFSIPAFLTSVSMLFTALSY